jgi:hypothetical protein
MPKPPHAKLAVVASRPSLGGLPPPGHLDAFGAEFWTKVTGLYDFDDPASLELLAQCCSACSRAERCRRIIDDDGELLRVGKAVRAHPLIREEIQSRALVARLLRLLGLDLEPVRSGPGRPPAIAP